MSFYIEQDDSSLREPFAPHTYRIFKDGRLIARYWHDYRSDEHGIEFVSGAREDWPTGLMTDFVEGGGPLPLTLSAEAVAYLQARQPSVSEYL